MIDTRLFESFISSLSKISGYSFQIWDAEGDLVFSSEADSSVEPSFGEFRGFSKLILSQAALQHVFFQEQKAMFGIPVKIGMDIIGCLIAYGPSFPEPHQPKPIHSFIRSHVKEMETFLIHLAELLEYQIAWKIETEKMAEELALNFEDLYLYSRIGPRTNTLFFSNAMLKELTEELFETMHSDLAFALLPNHPDYNALILNERLSDKIADPKAFVESLVNEIPGGDDATEENYFIITDSNMVPKYNQLCQDPYRFLAVAIQSNENFYGWLGLVSFNLKEIFRRSELKLLESVASSTAIAFENSRLYSKSIEMAQKERFIRNIFQKYVPEAVANEILDRGERDLIRLGEKRLVTLLNVDIRGYSRMSKKLRAEDVVLVLNHFFMIMGTVILKHKGILDKYLGDGILAIFGAPVASRNPPLDATLAAIEMVACLEKVKSFAQERYGIPLAIGISINTGEAILGNIGFEKKMEYTVIGDVVNDTFRLQELTREKPNSILISKTTYQQVQPFVHTRPLGFKTLGKNESRMEVYEISDQTKMPERKPAEMQERALWQT